VINWSGRIIDYLLFTIDYWYSAEGGLGNAVMVVLLMISVDRLLKEK
jgi:hypothetical protein